MNKTLLMLSLVLFGIGAECALAQKYPTRPIRLVVASSPGGASDILARLLAQKLGDELGQQVVVDNRGGASGVIGTGIVASASPDGYTLLIIQPSLTINPSMVSKLPYDATRDFAPVSCVVEAVQIMTVNPAVPAKSVKDLIALARAKPGQINFGSPGLGTSPHMTAELFKQTAGVDMPQVLFKGSGAAFISLVSGEVSAAVSTALSAMPHVKSGRIRPLAVTASKRIQILPNVPTFVESGLPTFVTTQWFGILAPGGTPRPIIDRLYQALTRSASSPDFVERMTSQGVDVVNRKPAEFAALIKSETAQWAKVIKAAGIKAR
ncbi:MAG TPA: tripartite tricarboxylate transporter substrate binding protein [Burkholderiales bacterium]|nr:tripartite tricarboxylate transporter substrate binding protein [Burkholderiales bacterium]